MCGREGVHVGECGWEGGRVCMWVSVKCDERVCVMDAIPLPGLLTFFLVSPASAPLVRM